MSKKLLIVVLLVGFLLSLAFTFYTVQSYNVKKLKIINNKTEIDPSIGSLIVLDAENPKFKILITEDAIYFDPFETSGDYTPIPITLRAKDYPKLFKQGEAKQSFILAEKRLSSVNNKVLILLSNNIPNRGRYMATYTLFIDPITGEISEEDIEQGNHPVGTVPFGNKDGFVTKSDNQGSGGFLSYKISIEENGKQETVYEKDGLYQGNIKIVDNMIEEIVGVSVKGDGNCCPSYIKHTFVSFYTGKPKIIKEYKEKNPNLN